MEHQVRTNRPKALSRSRTQVYALMHAGNC